MSKYFYNTNSFLEPVVKQYGSHQVMTNVCKSTRNTLINIDTRYKDETTYSSATSTNVNSGGLTYPMACVQAPTAPANNVTTPYLVGTNTSTNCNITLSAKINAVTNMSVENAEIPISFYNISTSIGNTTFKIINLHFNPNVETIIQLDDGEYTADSLILAINAKLVGTGFTISMVNGRTTISRTSYTNPISIHFDVLPNGSIDKFNFKRKLGWLLGFRKTNYFLPPTSDGLQIISDSLANLNTIRYAYLIIDEFTKNSENTFISNTNFVKKNIIAKITFNKQLYPFGSIQPVSIENGYLLSDSRDYGGKIDLQKMNVQLVDELGIPIDLNGNDFSFCIKIEHEE